MFINCDVPTKTAACAVFVGGMGIELVSKQAEKIYQFVKNHWKLISFSLSVLTIYALHTYPLFFSNTYHALFQPYSMTIAFELLLSACFGAGRGVARGLISIPVLEKKVNAVGNAPS